MPADPKVAQRAPTLFWTASPHDCLIMRFDPEEPQHHISLRSLDVPGQVSFLLPPCP